MNAFPGFAPRHTLLRTSERIPAPELNLAFTIVFSLLCLFLLLLFFALTLHAQVITVDKNGNFSSGSSAPVDRRYAQIQPTKVDLPKTALDARGHQDLLRALISEQGFAMRPFPRGHKGLELAANGKLKPSGEEYIAMVTNQGLAAKPGERLLITDIKIESNRIVFDLNGGPDAKHRFLRHISIGVGDPSAESPIIQGDEQAPTGARLTLAFNERVPDLTADQVKALLAPLISFGVKSPIEAFTDTLPPSLKAAILDHHVLVGMSTEMLLFALGEPLRKSREMDGQMPFEEWIYGQPPADVQFVRVNGNRVIQVEIAKVGYPPRIFTKDEVAGLMRTDGTPVIEDKAGQDKARQDKQREHTIQLGDVRRDPETQAPAPAPSLANPGEKMPNPGDQPRSTQVRFPKPHEDSSEPNAGTPSTVPATTAPATPSAGQPEDQSEDQKPNQFVEVAER